MVFYKLRRIMRTAPSSRHRRCYGTGCRRCLVCHAHSLLPATRAEHPTPGCTRVAHESVVAAADIITACRYGASFFARPGRPLLERSHARSLFSLFRCCRCTRSASQDVCMYFSLSPFSIRDLFPPSPSPCHSFLPAPFFFSSLRSTIEFIVVGD